METGSVLMLIWQNWLVKNLVLRLNFVEIDWDNKVMELDSKNIDVVWNGMTLTERGNFCNGVYQCILQQCTGSCRTRGEIKIYVLDSNTVAC